MLGMTERELGEMTPCTFQNKVDGFDMLEKTRVSIVRWQTANIMNSSGNYKKQIAPKDLMRLDGIDDEVKVMSKEEQVIMLKKYKLPLPKGLE